MAPLLFLSRHAPTPSQRELAAAIGFDDLRQVDVQFDEEPGGVVASLGVPPHGSVAVVAPLFVGLTLLRAGYTVIEFVNSPVARQREEFSCVGAYTHTLIHSTFTKMES